MNDPVMHAGLLGSTNNPSQGWLGVVTNTHETNDSPYTHERSLNTFQNQIKTRQHLHDTLLDLTLMDDKYTNLVSAFPIEEAKAIRVKWSVRTNVPALLRPAPEGTAGDWLKNELNEDESMLQKYKTGFKYSHDFMYTEQGRVQFVHDMRHIASVLLTTLKVRRLRSVFAAGSTAKPVPKTDAETRLCTAENKAAFAIVQKRERGFEQVNKMLNDKLRLKGGKGDMIIIHESAEQHMALASENAYHTSGKTIDERPYARDDIRNPNAVVSGVPVWYYAVIRGGAAELGPLRGEFVMNGSYNTMFEECRDFEHYKSLSRDRRVYDENIDDNTIISFKKALMATGIFGKNGNSMKNINKNGGETIVDFLTDAKGNPIQYLGDMKNEHLDENFLANATKAITSQISDAVKNAVEVINIDNGFILNNIGVITRSFIAKYFGKDNFYLTVGGGRLKISDDPVETINAQIGLIVHGLLSRGVPVTEVNGTAFDDLDEEHKKVLLQVAPVAKKVEIQAILDSGKSMEQKGQEVHDKYVEFVEDPKFKKGKNSPFKFKNSQNATDWYKKRTTDYNNAKEKIAQKQTKGKVVGFTAPGRNLSGTNYRYLHASAADPPVENGLDSNHFFRNLADSHKTAESLRSVSGSKQTVEAVSGLSGAGRVKRGRRPIGVQMADTTNMSGRHGKHFMAIDVNNNLSKLESFVQFMLLGTKMGAKSMLRFHANNVPIPINIALVRSFQSRHGHSAIKCASKGETGKTFIFQPRIAMANNNLVGQGSAGLSLYVEAIVTKPHNVAGVKNVSLDRYNGGNGTEFWTPDEFANMKEKTPHKSIIAIPIPITVKKIGDSVDNSLHLLGHFKSNGNKTDVNAHYSTYKRVVREYKLDGKNTNNSKNLRGAQKARHRKLNMLSLPAKQWSFDTNSGKWINETMNGDFFGPDLVGPGSAAIRCGKNIHGNLRRNAY